jgi:hypothetical protein
MNAEAVVRAITTTLAGVEGQHHAGDWYFFTGTERMMPFATLVTSNAHDTFSDLDRPGVFRLNIGVSKATFHSLLGADFDLEGVYDYTALDRILPHPVYGKQYWVSILNPSEATFEATVRPLLAEAHARSAARDERRDRAAAE